MLAPCRLLIWIIVRHLVIHSIFHFLDRPGSIELIPDGGERGYRMFTVGQATTGEPDGQEAHNDTDTPFY